MLIANMGLFWKREAVFWGGKNNAGRLLGRLKTGKKAEPVDFWSQIGIYALYADYRLVYVGQVRSATEGLGKRLKTHARYDEHAGRWDAFSWFGVRYVKATAKKNQDPLSDPPKSKLCPVDELLDILEGIAIEIAEPPLNSQGGRFTKDVETYLQERDTEKLGLPQSAAIQEILNGVGKLCKKLKVK